MAGKENFSGLKIGINSSMIKEIYGGPIFAKEVDLIEMGLNDAEFVSQELDFDRLDQIASLGNKFSIHAPYNSNNFPDFNLGVKSQRNFMMMDNVFKVADYLNAEAIVLHGDGTNQDYHESFLNLVANLKLLCKQANEHSTVLLIENLHKEKNKERIGVLPHEILSVIEAVNEENLKFCFDIGHANISANQYKFDILEFVSKLSPYLYQTHIHDNMGIPEVADERFGDQHLGLGMGNIDFNRIFEALDRSVLKNMVLELKPSDGRADALKSIGVLKAFKERTNCLF